MAAAGRGRRITVHTVLLYVLIVLAGLVATGVGYRWLYQADSGCSLPAGPKRTVAVRFAGTTDRVEQAARLCVDPPRNPADQYRHDENVVMRDLVVALAYTVTLAAACRLANVLVRRRVTREMGERLLAAVVVLGLVHVAENYVLAEVLRNPFRASGVVVGGLTAVAVTRCLILSIAIAFAIAGLGAGLAVLFRSLLGKSLLPEFDRPLLSVPDPTPEMGTRLDDAESELVVARPYARRFLGPDGRPWRSREPAADEAAGACFSGGGIRAASYALGALQGLQRHGALGRCRYLATVSGGGYTGTAWQIATRAAYDDRHPPAGGPGVTADSSGAATDTTRPPLGIGSPEERHLRRNARFLWPPVKGHSAWSTTLTFFAVAFTALRGIVFNAGLLVTLLFVVSRPLGWLTRTWTFGGTVAGIDPTRPRHGWQVAALALEAAGVVAVAWPIVSRWWRKMSRKTSGRWVVGLATTVFASWSAWMVLLVDDQVKVGIGQTSLTLSIGWWFVVVGALIFAAWAALARRSAGPGFGIAVVALGLVKLWLDGGFANPPGALIELHVVDAVLRVLVLLVVALVLLAILRLIVTHDRRTLSIWVFVSLMVASVVMTALAVAVLWPRSDWWAFAVAAGPAAGLGLTLQAFRQLPKRGQDFEGGPVNATRTLVALVFTASFTALWACMMWRRDWLSLGWEVSDFTRWAVLAGALLLVYGFVDQKWWSPHNFYKRRLSATFAPVRARRGNRDVAYPLPFRVRTALPTWARRVPGQPELLLCAAAYDTERIRPEENQAVPFVFTADHVGSADIGFMRSVDLDAVLGRQNEAYGTLLAASTISGAAVSPAIGAVRYAALSQIMAFLNLRLGVWLPSPASANELRRLMHDDEDSDHTLRWVRTRRLGYLLKELVGRYDTQDRFVYVTDGGQFENLGMYELLARRCRLIYAFDASADKGTVRSVLHSMRMARDRLGVDFGPVDADRPLTAASAGDLSNEWRLHLLGDLCAKPAKPGWPGAREYVAAAARFSAWYPPDAAGHRARATVIYSQARLARDSEGRLPDVHKYAAMDPKFPNNSTGDQFIDDAQFEAYVVLGRWAAAEALRLERVSAPPASPSPPAETGANGDGPGPAPRGPAQSAPTTPGG